MMTTILNTNDHHSTLITINVAAQTPDKLTSTNYLAWKLQFQTLFIGYDLHGLSMAPILDQLLLNAILGSLSPTIMPFIAQAHTSSEAWTILANTYVKPSRGRIKQVKNQFKHITKGSMGVSKFLQTIKARADELATLGAPVDAEDLSDQILEGLGDDYKELTRAVQARDNPISFYELHEKLLNFEASLQYVSHPDQSYFPASAHLANRHSTSYRQSPHSHSPGRHTGWRSTSNNSSIGWRPSFSPNTRFSTPSQSSSFPSRPARPPSKPYFGFFQICRIQGHTAKYCPSFKLIPITTSSNTGSQVSTSPWHPTAHLATTSATTPPWLLDSGASHHVTSDLHNLSLHAPYQGSDDIMIGDGTTLPITHTGSTSLSSSNIHFSLTNVLCVPSIQKNLISISKFCISNNASIEFLPCTFVVKDLHTGAILLTGKTKDGVYAWPTSTPLIAFSSVKTTSSTWHHRLGHPALPILQHVISKHGLDLSSSSLSKLYSLTQSAYLCYDPSTSKVFVSTHVRFIESIFPFTSTLPQAA
ncbi:hypothetical protein POTOM_041530 [Populus tomentosa]|uniref:GAG-pre-integrase domain-containing protein n=1 Tax=Populus tomentosa TaxID=118781 RepID=A0A8X7YU52_POPTO|nr:hypothetical protein POTOM_041530 [Populus tomentosa]